jgi:hypothetical protein
MKKFLLVTIAIVSLAAPDAADAADIAPVYKAPPSAISAAYDNGVYVWVDGSYQSIGLPTFDLGFKRVAGPPFPPVTNLGPVESYDPRATGYGIASAIGYIFPHGTFASAFGSDVRIELGVSHVSASARQSGTSAPGSSFVLELLDGTFQNLSFCGSSCVTSSTLATDYNAWQANLKAASDFRFGAITLTPSLTVFGGAARNSQSFSQQLLSLFTTPPGLVYGYTASSSLDWKDWGAKLGLVTKLDLTNSLALGLGGSIGFAGRLASLAAADTCVPASTTCFFPLSPSSAISTSATTTAFLANAEANLTMRPLPRAAITAFAGVNYDGRVPGISAPTFSVSGLLPVTGTPAGIKFESTTSYYVGGGVTVTFAP